MEIQLPQVLDDRADQPWMSIDQIRSLALSGGCTPAEFTRAANIMGNHPLRIARYLKRHCFVPGTFEIPPGGRFPAWEAKVQTMTA